MGDFVSSTGVLLLVVGVLAGVPLTLGLTLAFRMPQRQRAGGDERIARRLLREAESMATRVSSQVEKHHRDVEEINQDLAADGAAAPEAVARLMAANKLLQTELAEMQREMQEQREKLESAHRDARTDPLTRIANRLAFDEELRRRMAQKRRQRQPFSLIMLDVDHFKKFNDTHGHAAGDEVLKEVASCVFRCMRDMDLSARTGGEEFSVLLPGTTLVEAKRAAIRLREAIEEQAVSYASQILHVTASVGVAEIADEEADISLLSRADAALYAAKAGGRNCVYFHDGRATMPAVAALASAAATSDVPATTSVPAPLEPLMPTPPSSAEAQTPPPAVSPSPTTLPGSPADVLAARKSLEDPAATLLIERMLARTKTPLMSPISLQELEQRQNPRHDFNATQFIAPYVGGVIPAPREFQEVECIEVSSVGFSYTAEKPETSPTLVVEFGAPPTLMYLSARVVHCTPIETPQGPRYKVGCRFTGRLQS